MQLTIEPGCKSGRPLGSFNEEPVPRMMQIKPTLDLNQYSEFNDSISEQEQRVIASQLDQIQVMAFEYQPTEDQQSLRVPQLDLSGVKNKELRFWKADKEVQVEVDVIQKTVVESAETSTDKMDMVFEKRSITTEEAKAGISIIVEGLELLLGSSSEMNVERQVIERSILQLKRVYLLRESAEMTPINPYSQSIVSPLVKRERTENQDGGCWNGCRVQ